jgi:hypothetical protein
MYETMYRNVYLTDDGKYTSFVKIRNAKEENRHEWACVGIFKSPHEAYKISSFIHMGINDNIEKHKSVNPRCVLDCVREFLLDHPYTYTDSRLSSWIIQWFETDGKLEMPKVAEFYVQRLSLLVGGEKEKEKEKEKERQ